MKFETEKFETEKFETEKFETENLKLGFLEFACVGSYIQFICYRFGGIPVFGGTGNVRCNKLNESMAKLLVKGSTC